MPEIILTILKYLFLSLIFLFLARAVRAMLLELYGPQGTRARPSVPAASGRPPDRVTVVPPDGAKPQNYPLGDELIIGRGEKCHVVLTDTYASAVHARVFKRGEGVFMEDMGSTNGTYLNRRKVTSAVPVDRGDRARIGKTELEFKK